MLGALRDGGACRAHQTHQQTIEVAKQISAGPSRSMNQSKSKPHGTVVAMKMTGLTTNRLKQAVPTSAMGLVIARGSSDSSSRQQWKQHSSHGLHATRYAPSSIAISATLKLVPTRRFSVLLATP